MTDNKDIAGPGTPDQIQPAVLSRWQACRTEWKDRRLSAFISGKGNGTSLATDERQWPAIFSHECMCVQPMHMTVSRSITCPGVSTPTTRQARSKATLPRGSSSLQGLPVRRHDGPDRYRIGLPATLCAAVHLSRQQAWMLLSCRPVALLSMDADLHHLRRPAGFWSAAHSACIQVRSAGQVDVPWQGAACRSMHNRHVPTEGGHFRAGDMACQVSGAGPLMRRRTGSAQWRRRAGRDEQPCIRRTVTPLPGTAQQARPSVRQPVSEQAAQCICAFVVQAHISLASSVRLRSWCWHLPLFPLTTGCSQAVLRSGQRQGARECGLPKSANARRSVCFSGPWMVDGPLLI